MQFSERPVLDWDRVLLLFVVDDNALLTYTHPFIDVSVTSNIIYDEDGAYYTVHARVCVCVCVCVCSPRVRECGTAQTNDSVIRGPRGYRV